MKSGVLRQEIKRTSRFVIMSTQLGIIATSYFWLVPTTSSNTLLISVLILSLNFGKATISPLESVIAGNLLIINCYEGSGLQSHRVRCLIQALGRFLYGDISAQNVSSV